MTYDTATWIDYAEALAFIGNSLLAPMSKTGAVGLEPAFWTGFPTFDDAHVAEALQACEAYANEAQTRASESGDPVQDVSVEYTRLFVGPPHPEAAPWETMYRPGSEGATVGFGQATFEMRELLREAGLGVSNENNQYADHVGIELLYASVLCRTCAEAVNAGDGEREAEVSAALDAYVNERLLVWLPKLQDAVSSFVPSGYFSRLLSFACALLSSM